MTDTIKKAAILAGLALFWLLYLARVVIPGARGQVGYATYYTMADITWHAAAEVDRVYDPAWFQARLTAAGFDLNDVYGANPPSTGFLLGPLLLARPPAGPFVWAGLNLLALAAGVGFLLAALRLPRRHAAWLLPLLAMSGPVVANFDQGQLYALLFLALSIVYWAILTDRPVWAGLSLGFMLAIKTAGVWLFLLLWRRRRQRLLLATLATAAAVVLGSLLWFGPAPWLAYAAALGGGAGLPARLVTAYQTMASFWGQLFIFDPRWNPQPALNLPWLANLLTLFCLVISFIISRRDGANLPPRSPQTTPNPDLSLSLTLSLYISLITANAPLAEEYHYVLVIPAALTAAAYAARARLAAPAWLFLGGALCLLALPLPYEAPALARGWWALLAFPRVFGAYGLWAWLLWGRRALSAAL